MGNDLKTFLLLRQQAVKSLGRGVFNLADPGESEGCHKCIFNGQLQFLLISNKLQQIRASFRERKSSMI